MAELKLYPSQGREASSAARLSPNKHAAEGIAVADVSAHNKTEVRKNTLYKKREAIMPRKVTGFYRTIKWAVLVAALAAYYILPWIRWDRGPGEASQAVLADFDGRRFYFFALEIWPQEVYYITGLLIVAALSLFLATALFGRVWCGYACPQTVWTDLFLLVERWIEGDRNKQIRLAKEPISFRKIIRKLSKHSIWLIIAAATGGAFVMYFVDAPTLAVTFFTGEASLPTYIFVGLLTFTTYMLAGTMREQVCIYMCPWPRIQGAMLDEHSLSVTYRKDRGETRGPHKKGETWEGRGDCIDCKACVAVCPMGIDIRDGLQLECINCGLCVDACNEIMKKIERPPNLIAYDTDANMARRCHHEKVQYNPVRPRTILYVVLITAISSGIVWGVASRSTLDVNVIKERSPPFVPLSDGSVRNGYTLKILNKADEARTFEIVADGPAGLKLTVLGETPQGTDVFVTTDADKLTAYRVFLTMPKGQLVGRTIPVTFRVAASDSREEASNKTVFETGLRE